MHEDDDDYDSIEAIPWRSKAWRKYSKCAGQSTELFYPPRDRDKYKVIADESKGVCKGHDDRPECVVRMHCLTYAISTEEEHGIWGGLSHRERNALMRKWKEKGSPLPLLNFVKDYVKAYKS